MNQKDITAKLLEDYEDVFADIVNVLLFNGQEIVLPEALTDATSNSQYKADDTLLHEQERDVSKLWKDKKINIALYGIENQTKSEKIMPLRILGYDGASYRSQLLKDASGELYPVVTIVLYFGWEKHWNHPKNLKSVVNIPPELDKYVNDYTIHVFEIAWLNDEQVQMFKSDFRIVAEFFTQLQKDGTYKPSSQEIKHVDAVLKMLSVFGQVEELSQFTHATRSKEEKTMNNVITKMIDQGREEGRDQGREEGRDQGREEGIKALVTSLRELNQSNEYILSKIIEKFHLTEEKAMTYL